MTRRSEPPDQAALPVASPGDAAGSRPTGGPIRENTRALVGADAVAAHLGEVAERIAAASSVLVTCHRGPDGDSVGSMIALAALLRQQGKSAVLYSRDLVPRRLKWLPLCRGFVRKLAEGARFDVTVVMDCADQKLLGSWFPGPAMTGELIALDHHTSAQPFGDIYLCDPEAASTGVLVARIARHLSWPISTEAALGLYVSLVSDTGSFRYSNTNAEALALASLLIERGVDPWDISERLFERASLARYRLLASALSGLELVLEGKVALMTITDEMIKQSGAAWEDSIDMVNYARGLAGVECGVLFTPARRGGVRVSLRSKGRDVDAGAVCALFGGGGHRGAASCMLDCDMAEARERALGALAEALGVVQA
jgi:bifunctional oligoribonuclease and PAP phosphatase NrnA